MTLLAVAGARRRADAVPIASIFDVPLNVAVDGNSIFANFYTSIGTFDNHLMTVEPLASSGASHGGVAVSGASWADLIAKAASTVDLLWDNAADNNVLVVMETINSLYDGATVATIKEQIETYLSGRLAAHPWRVVYVRTMPYGGGAGYVTFNANMTEIDDWVQANAITLGVEVVIDPRVLPVFDHDGTSAVAFTAYASSWNETSAPYVHPLDTPKLALAGLIVEAMEAMPVLVRPYNGTPVTIPTPDSSGFTVHPSVVDMGTPWNGYRYWLADTPYKSQSVQKENPCIWGSHDGLTWEVPAGLTNPIDPWPGSPGYNSDTELHYDPDTGRMICFWRDYTGEADGTPGNLIFCASWSTDGVTWTPQIDLISWTFPDSGGIFSPAVCRVGPNDWRMWAIGSPVSSSATSHLYTAADPLGEWTGPTAITFNGTNTGGLSDPWHGDVIRTSDGIFRYILGSPRGDSARLYAASSLDGITWSGFNMLIEGRNDWDRQIYRATLVEAPGGVLRCWYSAYDVDDRQPRIGHTVIPLTEWPAPPTP